jgi:hypothetical protein
MGLVFVRDVAIAQLQMPIYGAFRAIFDSEALAKGQFR